MEKIRHVKKGSAKLLPFCDLHRARDLDSGCQEGALLASWNHSVSERVQQHGIGPHDFGRHRPLPKALPKPVHILSPFDHYKYTAVHSLA